MCGIFFSVGRDRIILPSQHIKDELVARGPDSYRELSATINAQDSTISLSFISSVLALRGKAVQEQPLHDPSSGSILCWNGEAWKLDNTTVDENDSVQVLNLLLRASQAAGGDDKLQAVVLALQQIAGPFAFVFYDAPNALVYYGRDRLGRRSLIHEHTEDDSLTLCSVSTTSSNAQHLEVATTSLHVINLKDKQITPRDMPWLDTLPAINKDCPVRALPANPSSDIVEVFLKHLKDALILRVTDIPTHHYSQMKVESAKVAILFSGGLDCTLLARLVHDILPHEENVDLLNVAFENPRALGAAKDNGGSLYECCPDRITGRTSFSELCQVCPGRSWRFVAINIPYVEVQAHRTTIQQLMHPHNTEMDLSIAMALYFAARGTGNLLDHLQTPNETVAYTSEARVLLSGLGADELYGGYARHAAAFARGGFESLADELELDFIRIGSRNLGRDDRVMSHWSKEVRYPYLDEDLVKFSLGLPVWEKCGFRVGRAIPKHYKEIGKVESPEDLEPAKMLLRLAMWSLDMKKAASERKRAIQFGARTAKMDVGKGKTRGTDVLVSLT